MSNVKALQKNDRADIQIDQQTTNRMVESLVLRGDISALNPEERARYYVQLCTSLGLTPATQPFAILRLNGKEICYPTRGATDQLAAIHRLTREIVDGPRLIDLGGTKLIYAVCRATHPNGRSETAVATVKFADFENALMKCETKAKRRATLSILGLGMLDETEIDAIPAHAKSPAPPIVLKDQPAAPDNDIVDPPHQDTPALDALREELSALGDTTLLKACRVLLKHKAATDAEAGGDLEYLHKRDQAVLSAPKIGATTYQVNGHLAALELRAKGSNTVFCDVMDLLELTDTGSEVAKVLRDREVGLNALAEETHSLLRRLAVRRVQELEGIHDPKQAGSWLKKVMKQPPEPPGNGGGPKPNGQPANDSTDVERESIQASDEVGPGSQTSASQLRAKLAECTAIPHLWNAFFKHVPGSGLNKEEAIHIAVERLVALGRDQLTALNMTRAEIRERGGLKTRSAA